MRIIGLSIPEWAALVGILTVLIGAVIKCYSIVKQQITAPVVRAIENLSQEISLLKHCLEKDHQYWQQVTTNLDRRLRQQERENSEGKVKEEDHDYYPVIDRGKQ